MLRKALLKHSASHRREASQEAKVNDASWKGEGCVEEGKKEEQVDHTSPSLDCKACWTVRSPN